MLALNKDRNAKWVFMCSYRKKLSERLLPSLRWYYFVLFISIFFVLFLFFSLMKFVLAPQRVTRKVRRQLKKTDDSVLKSLTRIPVWWIFNLRLDQDANPFFLYFGFVQLLYCFYYPFTFFSLLRISFLNNFFSCPLPPFYYSCYLSHRLQFRS